MYKNTIDTVAILLVWFMFAVVAGAVLLADNDVAPGYNPWVIIETDQARVWIKRDKIVSVSDHRDADLRRLHGKAVISMMNGKELHFDDYTANQLIELINK